MKNIARLDEGEFFHVFNRANGESILFNNSRHYSKFLQMFRTRLSPYIQLYAFCLVKNHFHFLIRVRTYEEIIALAKEPNLTGCPTCQVRPKLTSLNLTEIVTQEFSNFFNAYAKRYNIETSRKGSLFMRPFKRKLVTSNDYLTKLFLYIHRNPVHHKFVDEMEDWPYSSYQLISANDDEFIDIQFIYELFGGKEAFLRIHKLENKEWLQLHQELAKEQLEYLHEFEESIAQLEILQQESRELLV